MMAQHSRPIEKFEVIYSCGHALALESKYKSVQDLGSRFVAYNPSDSSKYSVFDDIDHFLQHLTSIDPSLRTYHEVILDVPQKLKFDIDAGMEKFSLVEEINHITPDSGAIFNDDLSNILGELFVDIPPPSPIQDENSYSIAYNDVFSNILKAIRDAFFVTFGYDIDRKNEIITSSHGDDKFSNHIIIDGFYVHNSIQAREFTRVVGSFLTPYYRKFLDLGVNKHLQNFRAPLCHKAGTMRTKKIITDHSPAQCLITNIIGCEQLPNIVTSAPERSDLHSDDVLKIIAICKQDPELHNHTYRYQRRGEFLFDRIRPTLCNFCLRTHPNDNTAYVVCVQNGSVYSVRRQCRRYIEEHGKDGNHFVVIGEITNLLTSTQTSSVLPSYCDTLCSRVLEDITAGKIPVPKTLFDSCIHKIVYNEPTIRPFIYERSSPFTLVVKAQMKMGKTKALKQFIDANFAGGIDRLVQPVIRFISFRQTFSCNIKEKFPDFTLYSDVKGVLDADRLIVQVESLHRIAITSDPPDLLVLDECESIFEQFDSGLLGGNFNECFAVFQYLIKYSRNCVLMDANISDRTFRILSQMRSGPVYYHHNTWQHREDQYFICGDKIRWLSAMYSSLDAGEKLALCTNSLTEAKTIFTAVSKKYPDRTVRMYSSETLESEKREHFSDVNTHWLVDVLIYTPTVSAGVSFEQKHFDRMFGYFTDQSCAVETCQQMIGRIRDVASKSYHLCFTATSNNLPTTTDKIEESLHNKRDRLSQQVHESGLRFEFGPTGEVIHHTGDYFRIWVENTLIRNLSKNSFIRRFITQIYHTGSQISMQPECECDSDKIRAIHLSTREEIRIGHANGIADAPEIDPEEANEIQAAMIARQDLSDIRRQSYEKYRLRRDYKYGGTITPKFVMKYHRKATRRIYKNISRLRTYPNMKEAWKEIQSEEHMIHSYLMNDGNESSHQTDLRRKYVFDQHRYAGGLLLMLGWNHIDDPMFIHRVTLEANINASNYYEIIKQACHEFDLKSPSPTTDVVTIVKQINKILAIMYGVIITAKSSSPDMFYLKQNTMFTDDPRVSMGKNRPLIGGNLELLEVIVGNDNVPAGDEIICDLMI